MTFISTPANWLTILDPCLVNLVHVEARVTVGLHSLASGPCSAVVVKGQAAPNVSVQLLGKWAVSDRLTNQQSLSALRARSR